MVRTATPGFFGQCMRLHKPREAMPNFLVIGAAKSGTTSLHEYLDQHPEIYMSPVKEPNFFAFEGRIPKFAGPSETQFQEGFWRRQQLRNARYELSITSLRDYQKLFAWTNAERALGESSVSYLYIPEAPFSIKKHLPNIRLIAMLRHPADRAYSKYMQFRRDGLEPIDDFATALEAEAKRIRERWSPTWFYKQRGFYYHQLRGYYEIFDHSQIKVFLYDEFIANPIEVMQRIFRFLKIDESFVPDMSQKHNVSCVPVVMSESRLLDFLLNTSNPIRSAVNRLFSPPVALKFRRLILAGTSRKFRPRQYEPMPRCKRRQLIDEYKADIFRLQELIKKDLSHWLQ